MKIKLRSLRLKNKMTALDLAVKAGVAKSTISKIENGDMTPSIEVLCKIAIALNVKIGEIVDCERRSYDDDGW